MKTNNDVETASEDETAEVMFEERNERGTSSKKYWIGGIAALASLSLIIGLSVGLTRKKDDDTNRQKGPEVMGKRPIKFAAYMSADGIVTSGPSEPLSYSMKAFGPKAINSYEDCAALDTDINNAASLMLSNAIKHEASIIIKWNGPYQPPPEIMYGIPEVAMTQGDAPQTKQESSPNSPTADSNNSPDSTTPPGDSSSVGDDYGTNNQVKGVDEADIVKSNGKYVFAAFGNEIVVWDAASGGILSRTKHEHQVDPPSEELIQNSPPIESKSMPVDSYWMNQNPKVETLLLHEDRLTVILSSGFIGAVRYDSTMSQNQNPVQALVYDISSIPSDGTSLNLVFKEDLKGNFIEARSIENFAHIITTSGMDTYWSLRRHVGRYNEEFWGLNSTEYLEKVKTFIEEQQIVEKFTKNIRDMVSIDGKCDHVMQLTLFQSSKSGNTTIPGDAWLSGIASAYTEITTLDMSASGNIFSRALSTPVRVTGTFLPNTWGTKVYASQNNLVLATPGMAFSDSWDESTYLMVYTLSNDGTPAKGHGTGLVPGYMLNQFSMDEWDGHLRVATTVRSKFGCVAEEQKVVNVDASTDVIPEPAFNVRTCVWKMLEDSDNMITILDMSTSSNDLEEVGSIKGLGLEGESIYAVRFMKEKAFMVTFRQTDPFYTFDLSDHTNPLQLGELKISGFSNYLHPYDADGNVMIAVGQEADTETGIATGMQISLYDVSDLSKPTRLFKYDVIGDSGGYSWSEAQHEHKAFRFYAATQKLILPASIIDKNYNKIFNGFKVYNIDKSNGISFHFDINHKSETKCWSSSYLSGRSMIHQGTLTTMKDQTIKAHNMETKAFKWSISLDNTNNCN